MSDQQTVSGAVEQAPKYAPRMSSATDELEAAAACYSALASLDPQSRYRVTGWLNQRLNREQADHEEEPF